MTTTPALRQDYATRIRASYQRTVEGIIEIGNTLIEAKENLPHGQFQSMVKTDLPFGPRQAEKYIAIARHPVLANANSSSHFALPSSVSMLYELTRFEPDELTAALREMERTKKKYDDEVLDIATLLIKKDVNRHIGRPQVTVQGVMEEVNRIGRPEVTIERVVEQVSRIITKVATPPDCFPELSNINTPSAPQVVPVENSESVHFPDSARRLPEPGISQAETRTVPALAETQTYRDDKEAKRLARVYAQEIAKWLHNFKGREQHLDTEGRDSLLGELRAAITRLEARGEQGGQAVIGEEGQRQ